MTKVGVFVDDLEEVYAELLSREGSIKFDHYPVDAGIGELASKILAAHPDVLALDYRLDEEGGLPADQTYKASALAQHLRDKAVENPEGDFCIVLVSAEDKIHALFDPDLTAHDLFDGVYVKAWVTRHAQAVQDELIGLSDGYELLRSKGGKFILSELMSAVEADIIYLDVQELQSAVSMASAPHQMMRFLLRNVIDKPGLLLDQYHSAARLGVDFESFSKLSEQLSANSVAYEGILSDVWPRWWSHRLEQWASTIFENRPSSLTARERAQRITAKLAIDVEPAISPWTETPDERVAVACASCRRGTEVRHSVSAYDGSIPRYRIARRICWDCVQTEKYKTARLQIEESDNAVAERVKTMARPSAA